MYYIAIVTKREWWSLSIKCLALFAHPHTHTTTHILHTLMFTNIHNNTHLHIYYSHAPTHTYALVLSGCVQH